MLLIRIPIAEKLPDARLTIIIKNNVVGQGSGYPAEDFVSWSRQRRDGGVVANSRDCS